MSESFSAQTAIDLPSCEDYVSSHIFRLRPPSYCKNYPNWPGLVGLEVEMQPFLQSSLTVQQPKMVPLYGPNSLSEMMIAFANEHQAKCNFIDGDSTKLLTLTLDQGDSISFEPGGQLEFSSIPYPCLDDAVLRMRQVQAQLDKFLNPRGVKLLQSGINPWQTVDEISLQMTKSRYKAMDSYFTAIGPLGRRMMRQTCTIQVNLDFGPDEGTMAKRYLLANLLSPFATALFAYSPYVNGVSNGSIKTSRAEAWRYIDDSRTGIPELQLVAQELDKNACVKTYLKSVLDAPVIFIEALNYEVPKKLRFRDWLESPYKGISPTQRDFETHLSLHFPEVRPRGFLEIRSIDCQSRVWQSAPATFYVTLLYVEACLDHALELLLPKLPKIESLLKAGTVEGFNNLEIKDGAKHLMNLVAKNLEELPECYRGERGKVLIAYNERFSQRSRCPSDDLLDAVSKERGGKLLPSTFSHVEEEWSGLIK